MVLSTNYSIEIVYGQRYNHTEVIILNLNAIPTEERNPDTLRIDEASTLEMLQMLNNEDKKAAIAVEKYLPQIAKCADAIAEKYAAGGRIIYAGAGTSGRIGFMDASEIPPTYSVEPGRFVALMAGGAAAFSQAVEGAEDNAEQGAQDLRDINFSQKDVFVGLAASGRTPYVIGAAKYAKSLNAVTVSITCNEDAKSPLNSVVDFPIGVFAGPEAITGSTRMKAGTVQKLVINMLSTAIMVKSGKVFSNLMVNVQIKNEKLRARAFAIIKEVTGAEDDEIARALQLADNNVSSALRLIAAEPSRPGL